MAYAGMVTSAVGGELQAWAAVLEKHAMFKEFQKEMARQQEYRDRGAKIFQGILGQNTPATAEATMKTGRATREKSYEDVGNVPLSVAPTTSAATTSPGARRDKATMQMRGQARARLGAYSDWQLKQTLDNIQNQEALQQLSSFAGGTAGVFPYKMYEAQHSLDTLAMTGAAISSLGGGAANYGQFSQQPDQQGPGGVQNWSTLPMNSKIDYQRMYNYYNDPYSRGYVAPGTYE